MSEQDRQEQHTEQAIKVRQVTDIHANWSAQERGESGKFSYQLILDEGAAEYVLRVTRSEEHTSELQSRQYLVCRLLLEKKKITLQSLVDLSNGTAHV